jgi:signal peptide peptidase SppA
MSDRLSDLTIDVSQYLGLWSIEPTRGQSLSQSLRSIDWNDHFASASERKSAGSLDGQYRPYSMHDGGVAVINIAGVMTKGGSSFSSDGSTIRIRQKIRQAIKDDKVSAIVLAIDSPGGTVAGTADLSEEIRKANESKPVLAFVEDLCASAAYFAAAHSLEIHANNETALVGSIGTYMVVYDLSGAFEKEGIKTHVIATGPYKGAGAMGSEITKEQLDHWQSVVDKSQKAFGSAVKSGRKLTDEELAAVSDGRVWLGRDAVKNKLIDAVSSFEEVVSRAASAAGSKRKGRTMSATNDDAPRGASLAELESALPGASSDFILAQLKRNATVPQAKESWLDARSKSLDERELGLKNRETELANREKAVAEKEAKLAQTQKGGGLRTVTDPDPKANAGGTGSEGSAEAQINALVAEKVAAGMSKDKALIAVYKANPDLRQRWIEEANAA